MLIALCAGCETGEILDMEKPIPRIEKEQMIAGENYLWKKPGGQLVVVWMDDDPDIIEDFDDEWILGMIEGEFYGPIALEK